MLSIDCTEDCVSNNEIEYVISDSGRGLWAEWNYRDDLTNVNDSFTWNAEVK